MPGLVAQVAGLRRRLAFLPAPARSSGEASTGRPVTVEMLVRGVWVDITDPYTMVRDDSGKIDIATGIQGGEGSQTERAQSKLTLKNQDGRFTPRNPTGPYYGAIGRNTPFRISVPDGLGGKSYRIWGENSAWEPGWDTSGTDVWVDTAIVGIMQRLAQAPAPERSVLYTALTTPLPDTVMAYWPMEDASGATSLASALPSGSPMTWTGTPTLASYADFPASDPVPETSATVFSGGVAKYTATGSTQVRFLCSIPAAGLTQGTVVCAIDQEDLGGTAFWELYFGNFAQTGHSFTLRQNMSDGSELGLELESTYDVRGRRLYVSVEFQQSGGTINRAVRLYDLDTQTSYDTTDTGVAATLTRVTRVQFGPASRSAVGPFGSTGLSAVAVGHATVENTITSNTILGAHLNPIGETAGRRIQRLCGEAGIPFEWIGDLDDTVAMGGQSKANTLTLVQEACLADGGLLYETKDVLGLGYRTRVSLYNQTPALVLSYTGFNFAEIPVPVEDDRQVQNQLTVTVNGVAASYEQTDGTLGTATIGTYGENSGLTLNLASTDTATLLSHAAWRVHLGTVDEARFPTITVNLAHPSITPDLRRAILALRMGDRAQFTGMPAWVGPDNPDQLILGTSETLTHFEHRITFVCAPASPYSYIGYLDTNSPRMDTAGSQLAADATSGATSLSVATTSGPVWVQYGQLNANRNFETDLSNWSGSGATIARVATPGSPPFSGLWSMQITPDGVATFPNAGSEQIAVTVGQQYTLSGWLYCATSRPVDLNINWFDGSHAYLSTSSSEQTVTANTWTWFQQTATAPVGAAFANLAPTVPTTPPSTDVLTVDEVMFYPATETPRPDEFPFDIRVGGEVVTVTRIAGGTSPQTFTVTRSVNGVVKAQTAGTAVELAHPYSIAL
ncbi:carbohydrate binding domain-containing protein [Streptomyces sp. NPDC001492]